MASMNPRRDPPPSQTSPPAPEQEPVWRPMSIDTTALDRLRRLDRERRAREDREVQQRVKRRLRRRNLPIIGRMLAAREQASSVKLLNTIRAERAEFAARQNTAREDDQLAKNLPDVVEESRPLARDDVDPETGHVLEGDGLASDAVSTENLFADYDDDLVAAWAADAMDRTRFHAVYGSNVEAPDAEDKLAIAEWQRRRQATTPAEPVDVQRPDEPQTPDVSAAEADRDPSVVDLSHVLVGEDALEALRRAEAGEDPDVVWESMSDRWQTLRAEDFGLATPRVPQEDEPAAGLEQTAAPEPEQRSATGDRGEDLATTLRRAHEATRRTLDERAAEDTDQPAPSARDAGGRELS